MSLLDILFPRRCVGCGKSGTYFCSDCRATIRLITPSETICPVCERAAMAGITHLRCRAKYAPDGLTVFFHYDGAVRQAIKLLKYRFVSDVAKEFVELVDVASVRHVSTNMILVPIPLHPTRRRYRGFNQSEVLGACVAEKLHIPMVTDILRRTQNTFPQAELANKKDRLHNVAGIFAGAPSGAKGKDILLFDDVFTTGATVRSATKALKRGGAKRVWVVTMAR